MEGDFRGAPTAVEADLWGDLGMTSMGDRFAAGTGADEGTGRTAGENGKLGSADALSVMNSSSRRWSLPMSSCASDMALSLDWCCRLGSSVTVFRADWKLLWGWKSTAAGGADAGLGTLVWG